MVELSPQRSDAIVLTEAQKEFACDEAAKGSNNDTICKALKISNRTLSRILARDPDFSKEVTKAREIWIHSLVEQLIGITKGAHTMAEVSACKIESENIKWVSGKYIPEIYGERIELNMNHHLDLSSVLLAAENRVLPLLAAKSALVTPPVDVESRLISDSRASFDSDNAGESADIPEELMDLV